MKYVIFKNSSYSFDNFGLADIARMREADVEKTSADSSDLATFRARGGKLLSYHGRKDDVSFDLHPHFFS